MKFWVRKLEGVLASSLVLALGVPAFGQPVTAQQPSFTPAASPTYLDGYSPTALPRPQATESGTVYSAPPVAEQTAPQTSQTAPQTSGRFPMRGNKLRWTESCRQPSCQRIKTDNNKIYRRSFNSLRRATKRRCP